MQSEERKYIVSRLLINAFYLEVYSYQSYKYRRGAEIGRVQETSSRDISAEHRQKSAKIRKLKKHKNIHFFSIF